MGRVLITGITGQDGSYLARQLVNQGHEVFGSIRRGSTPKTGRLESIGVLNQVELVSLELTEFANVQKVLSEIRPERIYNLAAQSFVADSFHHPHLTSEINYFGVLNILEAIQITGIVTRFYQASTSEMYGEVLANIQSENTPFNPVSPYAISKLAAHHLVRTYRMAYGLHASCGIMFNHESELRGYEFVTRKISSWVAQIRKGRKDPVPLGNMNAVRDWGYAPEFVEAMSLIVEAEEPMDYVVATNTETTVREFLSWCCEAADMNVEFDGEGADEICIEKRSGQKIAVIDPKYYRAVDVVYLRGDYSKIEHDLGWRPRTNARELAQIMTEHDLGMS